MPHYPPLRRVVRDPPWSQNHKTSTFEKHGSSKSRNVDLTTTHHHMHDYTFTHMSMYTSYTHSTVIIQRYPIPYAGLTVYPYICTFQYTSCTTPYLRYLHGMSYTHLRVLTTHHGISRYYGIHVFLHEYHYIHGRLDPCVDIYIKVYKAVYCIFNVF